MVDFQPRPRGVPCTNPWEKQGSYISSENQSSGLLDYIVFYCPSWPAPLSRLIKQWNSSRALEKLKGRHGFMPIYTNRRDGAQLRNLFFSLVFKGSALEFIDFGPNRPKKWPWVVTGKGHLCELSTPGARGAQCPRVHN